jgi:hypothetical protein
VVEVVGAVAVRGGGQRQQWQQAVRSEMQTTWHWQTMAQAAEGTRTTASTETRIFSTPRIHPSKNHTEKCMDTTIYVTAFFLQVQKCTDSYVKSYRKIFYIALRFFTEVT